MGIAALLGLGKLCDSPQCQLLVVESIARSFLLRFATLHSFRGAFYAAEHAGEYDAVQW
jgi:hypothetical protein